jgi:hypothetical protein
MVSYDLSALALDKPMDGLKNVLQGPRAFHRESRPHQPKKHHQKQKYQQLHSERIRNRRLGVPDVNVERLQKPGDRPGEEVVQKRGKPELFLHESALAISIESGILKSMRQRYI